MPIPKPCALFLPVLLALCPLIGAQDGLTVDGVESVDGSNWAAAKLNFEPESPYPGQTVRVSVDVLLRDELLDTSLLQLFRRELDLQIQLRFPAIETHSLESLTAGDANGLRYALGNAIGSMQASGKTQYKDAPARAYRASWSLVAERPGDLTFQGPQLRFAYTSGFRPDTLAGSVAMDRIEAVVQAEDHVLTVRDFPEAGRPLAFRGDLGPVELVPCMSEQRIQVGRPFLWGMLVRDCERRTTSARPSFPQTSDFVLEETSSGPIEGGVSMSYLLRPTQSGPLRMPVLKVAYFDPRMSAYGLAESSSSVIQVEEANRGSISAPNSEQGQPPTEPGSGTSSQPWPERLALPLAAVLLVILWRRRTRRKRPPENTGSVPDNPLPGTPLAHLRDALQARLGKSPAEFTNDGLARSLRASGLQDELAQAAANLFESLDGERFGGPALQDPEAQVQALLERVNSSGPDRQ